MNDILVYGRTREEHDHSLDEELKVILCLRVEIEEGKIYFWSERTGFCGTSSQSKGH